MTAPMNFRSAINGFKREDVVSYIEYLTARHTAELNQLRSEIEYLRSREIPTPAEQESAEVEALNNRIHELLERCAQLEDQQIAAGIDAEEKLKAAEARCAELELQLQDVQNRSAAQVSNTQLELEAYRRAERAERLAQERAALVEKIAAENAEQTRKQAADHANAVCTQVNAVLAEASLSVDSAAGDVSALAESVMAQLQQLHAAIDKSQATLRAASDKMYAVHSPSNAE
jgi:DNA repair exonuclease SbcCD ATPase subunit